MIFTLQGDIRKLIYRQFDSQEIGNQPGISTFYMGTKSPCFVRSIIPTMRCFTDLGKSGCIWYLTPIKAINLYTSFNSVKMKRKHQPHLQLHKLPLHHFLHKQSTKKNNDNHSIRQQMKPETTSEEQRMKQEKIFHVILKLLMNIKNKPSKQLEKQLITTQNHKRKLSTHFNHRLFQ